MIQFRKRFDAIFERAKKLSTILVFSKDVEAELRKYQKNLTLIDSNLGSVNVRFTDISVEIHIHAKTQGGLKALINSIDFFFSRCANKTSDGILIEKRERMKNLNFVDIGVGGLSTTIKTMIRRTFESRLIPPQLRIELGLSHTKGCLLYGPPGTGKTLIARKVAEILGCQEPKIVNGPEVESKWVGEAEKKIRGLFEDAEKEFEEAGQKSQLHVIIFDEIDAIAKERGGPHAKSRDGALNQLLCCLDGVESLDNVLIFGLTNRKDCLDPALLRPGRLEVQLDIGLPDAKGREDILHIHTETMRQHGRLAADVDLQVLAQMADDFSGADIAGMIRSATSYALEDMEDEDEVMITQELLQKGLHEVRFARERLPSDEEPESNYPGLLQA